MFEKKLTYAIFLVSLKFTDNKIKIDNVIISLVQHGDPSSYRQSTEVNIQLKTIEYFQTKAMTIQDNLNDSNQNIDTVKVHMYTYKNGHSPRLG